MTCCTHPASACSAPTDTIGSRPSTHGRISPRTRRTTYALLLTTLGLALAVSGTPSPLYGTYARDWHLSPLTLTIVFAAYAVAAMGALLVAGPATDALGRKPALIVSAAGLVTGLVIFMTAHNVVELVIARMVHGASIGTAAVAVGAALLDLRPDDGARTGHLTGIVLSVGMGAGVLGSAVVAQLLPHPLVLPYAVIAVLAALALLALAASPETHRARTGRLRIVRPGVPAEIMGDFSFATLGAAASWVMLGIYLSLFPQLAAAETRSHTLLLGGSIVGSMMVGSALAQAVAVRAPARRLALTGDVAMAAASLISVPMVLSANVFAIFAGAILIGATFGIAFSGSFRHLGQIVPAGQRGGVMSAFYLCCYVALAVPTVAAGAAATRWGLPHTYAWFAVIVAACCGSAAVVARRASARASVSVPV